MFQRNGFMNRSTASIMDTSDRYVRHINFVISLCVINANVNMKNGKNIISPVRGLLLVVVVRDSCDTNLM